MSMNAVIVPTDDVGQLEMQAVAWPDRARAVMIADQPSYAQAAEMLTGIKGLRDAIAKACDPVIAAAHHAHRVACQQKRDLEAPLAEAEGILKQAIGHYLDTEERTRRQQEADLRAQQQQEEEFARLAEADALEQAGDAEAAAAVLEAPPPPPPVLPAPKAEGVSARTLWRWRLTDAAKLPRAYLMPDERKISGVVKALGSAATETIDGIEVYAERVIAARKG